MIADAARACPHPCPCPSAMTGWNPNGQRLVLWPEDFLLTWSTGLATGAAGHGTQGRRPLEQPPNRAGQGWCMSTLAPLPPDRALSEAHSTLASRAFRADLSLSRPLNVVWHHLLSSLPFPVLCPHAPASVSWGHLPNKLLHLESVLGSDSERSQRRAPTSASVRLLWRMEGSVTDSLPKPEARLLLEPEL